MERIRELEELLSCRYSVTPPALSHLITNGWEGEHTVTIVPDRIHRIMSDESWEIFLDGFKRMVLGTPYRDILEFIEGLVVRNNGGVRRYTGYLQDARIPFSVRRGYMGGNYGAKKIEGGGRMRVPAPKPGTIEFIIDTDAVENRHEVWTDLCSERIVSQSYEGAACALADRFMLPGIDFTTMVKCEKEKGKESIALESCIGEYSVTIPSKDKNRMSLGGYPVDMPPPFPTPVGVRKHSQMDNDSWEVYSNAFSQMVLGVDQPSILGQEFSSVMEFLRGMSKLNGKDGIVVQVSGYSLREASIPFKIIRGSDGVDYNVNVLREGQDGAVPAPRDGTLEIIIDSSANRCMQQRWEEQGCERMIARSASEAAAALMEAFMLPDIEFRYETPVIPVIPMGSVGPVIDEKINDGELEMDTNLAVVDPIYPDADADGGYFRPGLEPGEFEAEVESVNQLAEECDTEDSPTTERDGSSIEATIIVQEEEMKLVLYTGMDPNGRYPFASLGVHAIHPGENTLPLVSVGQAIECDDEESWALGCVISQDIFYSTVATMTYFGVLTSIGPTSVEFIDALNRALNVMVSTADVKYSRIPTAK